MPMLALDVPANHPSVEGGPALAITVSSLSKRFGPLLVLDGVSLQVPAGSFHALLGENGAGKSTLVKCLVGYHRPESGQIRVDGVERSIRTPHDAHALGIGMVYQHFTLVPSMTVAENLVMSRGDVPAIVRWRDERERLREFMAGVPFQVPLDVPVSRLAAGEKQKVEILKQLYLRRRFVILDEPTSVLTPQEATGVLGVLKDRTAKGELTVLMITHKFKEVMRFADAASVLRRGVLAGEGPIAELDPERLAEWMVGTRAAAEHPPRTDVEPVRDGVSQLVVRDLHVDGDAGQRAVDGVSLQVDSGEILGIAGVSGNGQRELVEALTGQRPRAAGEIRINGERHRGRRAELRARRVYSLPEEPLRNACVRTMSVAENLALRNFDAPPLARAGWLRAGALREQAVRWIEAFRVRTRGPDAPIGSLSGGNVQRAVLARELSHSVSVLIAANPTFGLDFAAVEEIHARIRAARNAGAAVLLVSEDLDELLALCDRIVVICAGRIAHETLAATADLATVGRAMAGHADERPGRAT